MIIEAFNRRLLKGEPIIGLSLPIGFAACATALVDTGLTWLVPEADCEATAGFAEQARAVREAGGAFCVRFRYGDPRRMAACLNAGAVGIVGPPVTTRAETEALSQACRFPPHGHRRWCGAVSPRPDAALPQPMLFPEITHADALAELDPILATDGISAPIVDPVDLSISLGVPFDLEAASCLDALSAILASAIQHGKPAGIALRGAAVNANQIRKLLDTGFQFILLDNALALLQGACTDLLRELRAQTPTTS